MRVFRQQYKDRSGKTGMSANWYVEIKDHLEVTRRIPGFPDKSFTTELGRKLEKLVTARALGEPPAPELARWLENMPPKLRQRLTDIGLLDSRTVASGKPLGEHLAEFHEALLAKGDTAKRAQEVVGKVRRILQGCRFTFYSDISASKVQRYLAELRDGGNGMSVQTSNHYLQAVKQFCIWMVKDRRASESPVAHLSRMNVKVDRRHDRRNLSAEELGRLLVTTAEGPKHHRLTGRARAMLYRVAMETGLRRQELRTLTPASFDLDGQPATVGVEPGDVKNRKPTVQAIRPELVAELKTWFREAGFATHVPLWPKLTVRTAEMLKRDLDAAGIPYVDDAGLFADFHALRHSYISLITAGGVHPKIAQRLARHSDINLTMSRYSHTLLEDEAKGLEALPEFPSMFGSDDDCGGAVLRATGTDGPSGGNENAGSVGESVLPVCLPEKGPFGRAGVHSGAVKGAGGQDVSAGSRTDEKLPKTSEDTAKNASGNDPEASTKASTPGRIRTCNPRFRRPMRYPVAPRAQRPC